MRWSLKGCAVNKDDAEMIEKSLKEDGLNVLVVPTKGYRFLKYEIYVEKKGVKCRVCGCEP